MSRTHKYPQGTLVRIKPNNRLLLRAGIPHKNHAELMGKEFEAQHFKRPKTYIYQGWVLLEALLEMVNPPKKVMRKAFTLGEISDHHNQDLYHSQVVNHK